MTGSFIQADIRRVCKCKVVCGGRSSAGVEMLKLGGWVGGELRSEAKLNH